jgi:hypothetical protein
MIPMTVAVGANFVTRMVAGVAVFQVMAGPTEVPPLTRSWHANTICSIDTGSQQKFIGRSMGVMAVGTHNDLVLIASIHE